MHMCVQVTKENVTNVVARLGEGSMTVVFKEGCCDSIVIKEVVDRGALTLCHKIISEIWMGVGEAAGGGTQWLGSSPTGRSSDSGGQSLSASGKRKMELTLKKRYRVYSRTLISVSTAKVSVYTYCRS